MYSQSGKYYDFKRRWTFREKNNIAVAFLPRNSPSGKQFDDTGLRNSFNDFLSIVRREEKHSSGVHRVDFRLFLVLIFLSTLRRCNMLKCVVERTRRVGRSVGQSERPAEQFRFNLNANLRNPVSKLSAAAPRT